MDRACVIDYGVHGLYILRSGGKLSPGRSRQHTRHYPTPCGALLTLVAVLSPRRSVGGTPCGIQCLVKRRIRQLIPVGNDFPAAIQLPEAECP
jgi:hypothetical protein